MVDLSDRLYVERAIPISRAHFSNEKNIQGKVDA